MKVFESLSRISWIRVGGIGEVRRPSSVDEFLECYGKGPVVGKGSNVLFAPTTMRIVSTQKLADIARVGSDRIKAQCGVANSKLLWFALRHGLGGIEYLASVPGSIAGAVFMNAGRGEKHKCAIGQRVLEVEFFDGAKLRRLSRDECGFSHRKSVFHKHPEWMIISVTLVLQHQVPERTQKMMKARKRYAFSAQDRSAPTLGTVFSAGYKHQAAFEGIRFGGIQWSKQSPNWMVNVGDGTYEECVQLIEAIRRQHANDPELEIRLL